MHIIQTKDYELVARLNKDVHELHQRLYPDIFKPYNPEAMKTFFKEKVQQPDAIFLVLEHDGEYEGYAWIDIRDYPETDFRKPSRSVYVHQLSINESARGKGCGRFFMDAIAELARERQITRIELDYWSDNGRARSFYEKSGFVRSREFVYKDLDLTEEQPGL
ncbi:GNAT family N-acetyltransferase [Gorillibacterium sp. sgz5001074]|uniref:GNAT family N-acetyltransferase n=1 Tax=Gorillibacterium sp. sgz5001074 TaxID=3446695 RepID=UPI003F67265C